MSMITKAKAFALEAHKDQTYGDLPYDYHLKEVVKNVLGSASYKNVPFGEQDSVVAAAWLHDVVEDTDVTLNDIRDQFGGRVARIVDFCTDEPGENRKERKAKTLKKIAKAPSYAKLVKLGDRLANMRASIENPGMSKMYRKEFPQFIKIVGDDSENQAIVNELFWVYIDSELSEKSS